jgi:hypothetical protein
LVFRERKKERKLPEVFVLLLELCGPQVMAPVPCVRWDSGWDWDYNLRKRRPDLLRARRCRRCGKRSQQSILAEGSVFVFSFSEFEIQEQRISMAIQ